MVITDGAGPTLDGAAGGESIHRHGAPARRAGRHPFGSCCPAPSREPGLPPDGVRAGLSPSLGAWLAGGAGCDVRSQWMGV